MHADPLQPKRTLPDLQGYPLNLSIVHRVLRSLCFKYLKNYLNSFKYLKNYLNPFKYLKNYLNLFKKAVKNYFQNLKESFYFLLILESEY